MTTPSPTGLRALFTGGSATGMTDGQLLERFQLRSPSSEAAFEALVDRHAAMVWGVCRRSLDRADAEDAFQATFLVLVRRVDSIRTDERDSVGRWLYGVARRVASRLRQEVSRRPAVSVDPAAAEDPSVLAERRDVREAVAVELDRLPSKYRRPIELCDFEGLTYEQAGVFLGWPTATLKNRLAQGRSRLRDRLTRRGLAPAAAVATAAMARECQAGVPRALVHSTCRAGAIASGTIPATVARLIEGVNQAMLWNKLKLTSAVLLSAVGATLVAVAGPSSSEEPPKAPPEAKTSNPAPEPDPRWTRRLPDLEIVAVSTLPSGPDTWWRPDGTPLKNPPFDPTYAMNPKGSSSFSSPDEANRRMIVYRVSDRSQAAYVDVGINEASAKAFGPVVTREGEPAPGLKAVRADFRGGSEKASLHFRIASGPWETIQRLGQGRGSMGSLEGGFVSSGAIPDKDGVTRLALAHNIDDRTLMRVVAVDEAGGEHLGVAGSASAGEVRQVTVRYPLPPEKIRDFRVQTRHLDELTIPNIALHPRKADEPR